MKTIFRKIFRRFLGRLVNFIANVGRDWEDPGLIMNARALMVTEMWNALQSPLRIADKEFRVYSQWGDDGIIQFLVKALRPHSKKFIEFGVADYFESNTHFLLVNNNWRGFVIDGSEDNFASMKSSSLFWRYSLQAEASFVTAENINDLLARSGFDKIGLLHIDLDGNDYWVLKALDLSRYEPDILILEYNSHFGMERAITVPYNPGFQRRLAHYSGQFFGASLSALKKLSVEKGYYFIGCNSAGNNAYFLLNAYRDQIPPMTIREGFVEAKFRDARDEQGNLVHWSPSRCKNAMRGLTVVNVDDGIEESF